VFKSLIRKLEDIGGSNWLTSKQIRILWVIIYKLKISNDYKLLGLLLSISKNSIIIFNNTPPKFLGKCFSYDGKQMVNREVDITVCKKNSTSPQLLFSLTSPPPSFSLSN
jgi:hypothetical protein